MMSSATSAVLLLSVDCVSSGGRSTPEMIAKERKYKIARPSTRKAKTSCFKIDSSGVEYLIRLLNGSQRGKVSILKEDSC